MPSPSDFTEHATAAGHELHLLTHPAVWLCALAAAFTVATAGAAGGDRGGDAADPAAGASVLQLMDDGGR